MVPDSRPAAAVARGTPPTPRPLMTTTAATTAASSTSAGEGKCSEAHTCSIRRRGRLRADGDWCRRAGAGARYSGGAAGTSGEDGGRTFCFLFLLLSRHIWFFRLGI